MAEQDVVVEFYYSGAWHASTVYARDPVVITRGKQDESSGPTPATATFTLDNRSGDWSTYNPNSSLYGLVGQNTPVRITLTNYRFWGEVAAMKPGRSPDFNPVTGQGDAWVEVEAAGPLRRTNQGADPLASPLRRALLATTPSAYWPLEDLTNATAGASAVEGVPAMEPYGYSRFEIPGSGGLPQPAAGLPQFATGSSIPGSLPVPDWSQGGVLVGRPPIPSSGTQSWRVAFAAVFPRDQQANGTTFIGWMVSTGTYPRWEIQADSGGLFVTASDALGVAGYGTSTITVNLFDGRPHFIEVSAETVSGALLARVWIDGYLYGTVHTINAADLVYPPGWVESITPNVTEWNSTNTGDIEGMPQLGHVAVWQPIAAISGHMEGMTGHPGETTLNRFSRLCVEQGIDSTFYSGPDPDDVQSMGIEQPATFAEQLAEIERTERGIIYEPRNAVGLILATGRGLAGQAVAATLDYAAGQLGQPFALTLDDQGRRNDVTARSTTTGAEAQRTLDDGPMSTQTPPDGIGRYATSLDVNPYVVDRLGSYARRAVADGTIGGLRFPRIVVDLVRHPGLADTVCNVDPGHRVQVVNLPADITPDTVDLVVLGTVETIGSHTRTIELLARPYVTVDAPVVGVSRVDSATSVLDSAAAAPSSSPTEWTFTAGSESWTGLNGSIAWNSSGSVTVTPNGVATSVEARSPNVAGVTAGESRFATWSASTAVTRVVTPGIIWRDAGGTLLSVSSGTPVTLTAGVPTDLSMSGVAPTGAAHAMLTLSMGSTPPVSHEITVYGARLYLLSTLSVSRSGVSNRWTTDTDAFPFDIAVGGGERCTVASIAGTGNPQTFTVARSVNGVARAWAAGTSVRLWSAPPVGL